MFRKIKTIKNCFTSTRIFPVKNIDFYLNEIFRIDIFCSLQVYRLNQTRNLSLENLGGINWENLGCLAIIYLICYFSMWKGVKTSGKVKYSRNKIIVRNSFVFFLPVF